MTTDGVDGTDADPGRVKMSARSRRPIKRDDERAGRGYMRAVAHACSPLPPIAAGEVERNLVLALSDRPDPVIANPS